MDIEKAWQNQKIEKPISTEEIRASIDHKPESILRKLRQKLITKLAFIVVFTVLYIWVVAVYHDLVVQLLLGTLIVSHLIGMWFFTKQWFRMRQQVQMDQPVLNLLLEYQSIIKESLRAEQLLGLMLYPVAASAGYFLALTQEHDWQVIFETRFYWIVWFASILVLTPVSHWATKWLNKQAFGAYLDELEEMIGALQDLEGDDLN